MTFRAPNRLRRELGDDYDRPLTFGGFLCFLLFLCAVAVLGAILLILAMVYPFQKPALGAELYRVPSICEPLAQRYSIPLTLSREDALNARVQLTQYAAWPGVRKCLRAVDKEWKL